MVFLRSMLVLLICYFFFIKVKVKSELIDLDIYKFKVWEIEYNITGVLVVI